MAKGNSTPRFIDLPKIFDARGNLSFINGDEHVPFSIGRVYFLYDVPAGSERGGHAHRSLEQYVVAVSGSFDLVVTTRDGHERFSLNRPYRGVLLGPMTWRTLENFSAGAVCLVLASSPYDEHDYIRDFSEFLELQRLL